MRRAPYGRAHPRLRYRICNQHPYVIEGPRRRLRAEWRRYYVFDIRGEWYWWRHYYSDDGGWLYQCVDAKSRACNTHRCWCWRGVCFVVVSDRDGDRDHYGS